MNKTACPSAGRFYLVMGEGFLYCKRAYKRTKIKGKHTDVTAFAVLPSQNGSRPGITIFQTEIMIVCFLVQVVIPFF